MSINQPFLFLAQGITEPLLLRDAALVLEMKIWRRRWETDAVSGIDQEIPAQPANTRDGPEGLEQRAALFDRLVALSSSTVLIGKKTIDGGVEVYIITKMINPTKIFYIIVSVFGQNHPYFKMWKEMINCSKAGACLYVSTRSFLKFYVHGCIVSGFIPTNPPMVAKPKNTRQPGLSVILSQYQQRQKVLRSQSNSKYQSWSTNINRYQPISTIINQENPLSIINVPSTNHYQPLTIRTTINL